MNPELVARIDELKRQRNATILAHNYEPDEIQEIADFTGDSLQLSRKAAHIEADVVVFCGVHFMAETASILSPDKTILMPVLDAGCEMADMVTGEQVRQMKAEHPGAAAVCYVNSSAEVKAECDCCCTSSNAMAVAAAFADAPEILFVPDRNLGSHVAQTSGQKLTCWDGYCPVHDRITSADILAARRSHPDAVVMVHPECTDDVRAGADEILSTGHMCWFAAESEHREFIVGTEIGILYRLRLENPGKTFHPLTLTPSHARITLADILGARQAHPSVSVVVHAECTDQVKAAADEVMTTEEMGRFVASSGGREIVLGVTGGILADLRVANPDHTLHGLLSLPVCPDMKMPTVESVVAALENMQYEVRVPEEIADRARVAIERMISLG
ncbi:MAG: quinolinate synthase NadA [Victivallales bacterium]|nr:quinolinate synthase NadA [Victivallales bacterium]